MGVFNALEKLIKKQLNKIMEREGGKEEGYIQLSNYDLKDLSNDKLFEAIAARIEARVDSFDEPRDGIASLNASQRLFYSLYWLDIEVNNGGLCQFFVNSSHVAAPFVSEAMRAVGATEHQKLFDDFIAANQIDPCDLSAFDVKETREFAALYEKYPFDTYDDAFIDLEPLESYLKKYAREHLSDF